MNSNGPTGSPWGYAVEGQPSTMLQIALQAVHRNGQVLQTLPQCNGEIGEWVRRVAECLRNGSCRAAVLFCRDTHLACCIANKVPGVRAAAVGTIAQARRALQQLGANLLVVEMAECTYFECKEILHLCCQGADCPPHIACILQELDGHAHR